MIVISKLLSKS